MKSLKAKNAKQNRQSKKHKKGAYYHGKHKQIRREK